MRFSAKNTSTIAYGYRSCKLIRPRELARPRIWLFPSLSPKSGAWRAEEGEDSVCRLFTKTMVKAKCKKATMVKDVVGKVGGTRQWSWKFIC